MRDTSTILLEYCDVRYNRRSHEATVILQDGDTKQVNDLGQLSLAELHEFVADQQRRGWQLLNREERPSEVHYLFKRIQLRLDA